MCVKYQTGKSVLSQGLEFESIHFPEHFLSAFQRKQSLCNSSICLWAFCKWLWNLSVHCRQFQWRDQNHPYVKDLKLCESWWIVPSMKRKLGRKTGFVEQLIEFKWREMSGSQCIGMVFDISHAGCLSISLRFLTAKANPSLDGK